MKKLFLIPIFLLSFVLCGCQSGNVEDYTSQLKLNINHINEKDEEKEINISYPVFGGIDDKETITIINTSISNFVNSQYTEFQKALTATEQDALSDGGVLPDVAKKDGDESSEETSEAKEYLEETAEDKENNEAAGEDGETKETITLSMSFKITYNKDNYLCVVQTYDKNLGKDKKFNGQRSFLFSLENATYLSLGEIFDFSEAFVAYVNDKITKGLAEGAYTTYDDNSGFTGISKNSKFYIDSNNIYIYYDALEISPDKDTVPTFAFPLKDVKKYLNEDFVDMF